MKAKILKADLKKSKHNGYFYHVFFKTDNGKSFRSCVYKECHNYSRWDKVVREFKAGKEVWLDNLFLVNDAIISADSDFRVAECDIQTQIKEEVEETVVNENAPAKAQVCKYCGKETYYVVKGRGFCTAGGSCKGPKYIKPEIITKDKQKELL